MKNGFTLFEVMIALAIMGSAVTVILTLASALFKTSTKSTRAVERIIDMKNMLLEVHEKPQTAHTQQRGIPVNTLEYTEKPVADKSAFKGIKNIVREQIQAQWNDKGAQRTDSLVFFLYKPEKQKSDTRQR